MADRALKIKVDRITARIQYVCDFIFSQRGFKFEFITDGNAFDLEYTTSQASSLLYSEEVLSEEPAFDTSNEVFVFNGISDYLASIFYVLTRMEEYVTTEKDHHGRFSGAQSVLKKYNLLDKVICDRWSVKILHDIGIDVPKPTIEMEPTFDIDNTFAYLHKKGIRRKLSIMRDRIQGNKNRLFERKRVEAGEKDPYDTFDLIDKVSKKFRNTKVFWLVESHGKFDRNLDIEHPEHVALIQNVHKSVAIGIHPSYASFCNVESLKEEKVKLEKIVGEVNRSRQHFLRLELPKSYQTLIAAGIHHDHSMGFADAVGFRAGTARVFPWFDLEKNVQTSLMIHPFAYMDGTLNEYLKLTPDQAIEQITGLYEEVQLYGGIFSFLWHNETIGEYNHWKGWHSVLDHTLSLSHE